MIHSNVSFVQLFLFAVCLSLVFTKVQGNGWKALLFVIGFLCTFMAHGLLPNLILIGISAAIVLSQ